MLSLEIARYIYPGAGGGGWKGLKQVHQGIVMILDYSCLQCSYNNMLVWDQAMVGVFCVKLHGVYAELALKCETMHCKLCVTLIIMSEI